MLPHEHLVLSLHPHLPPNVTLPRLTTRKIQHTCVWPSQFMKRKLSGNNVVQKGEFASIVWK